MAASRKLYRDIAVTIRLHVENRRQDWDIDGEETLRRLAVDLCSDFKQDNIHFNREKFLRACGLEE